MKLHSICESFPELSKEEFHALVLDIKTFGLHHEIITYKGAILDGRHRYKACLEAGVEPRFREFQGTDDEAWMMALSENLRRRHLTVGQRAMLSLPLYDIISKNAIAERGRRHGIMLNDPNHKSPECKKHWKDKKISSTAFKVGEMVGVSVNAIVDAVTIRKHAPDIVGKVVNNSLSLAAARKYCPKISRAYNKFKNIPVIHEDAFKKSLPGIPTLFDSYEKFMLFLKDLSDCGYVIQTVWSRRKIFTQVVKEGESFESWARLHNELDWKRSVFIESGKHIKVDPRSMNTVAA